MFGSTNSDLAAKIGTVKNHPQEKHKVSLLAFLSQINVDDINDKLSYKCYHEKESEFLFRAGYINFSVMLMPTNVIILW